jgi:hypothetical protein
MTLLLLSWLVFAPAFLLFRRVLLAPNTPTAGAMERCSRTSHEVAARLHVHLTLLVNACDHAQRAHAEGRDASMSLMLSCVRQGVEGLVHDLDADVAAWRAATSGLTDAPDAGPALVEPLHSVGLRALAWSHQIGCALLPGRVARLRLHLWLLRGMLAVIRWEASRIQAPPGAGTAWRELAILRADAPAVVAQARRAHLLLLESSCSVAEVWRLAT